MRDLAQQLQVENRMLTLLIEGIRNTLAWEVQAKNSSRKVSTLRFIADSFQRHMERLLTLEERDGYMEVVLQANPHLEKTVNALRQDHDLFRKTVKELIGRLERVSPSDQAAFAGICEEFAMLLNRLDAHHEKEGVVLQEAFEREVGGEG